MFLYLICVGKALAANCLALVSRASHIIIRIKVFIQCQSTKQKHKLIKYSMTAKVTNAS